MSTPPINLFDKNKFENFFSFSLKINVDHKLVVCKDSVCIVLWEYILADMQIEASNLQVLKAYLR